MLKELLGDDIDDAEDILVDGISYKRIGDSEYYAQELLELEELTGYLTNMLKAEKSV